MLNKTFTERMKARLGDDAPSFLQSLETPAPVSIRRHPGKTGRAEVEMEQTQAPGNAETGTGTGSTGTAPVEPAISENEASPTIPGSGGSAQPARDDTDAGAGVRSGPVKKTDNLPERIAGIVGEPVPWARNGYYLQERPVFTLDPAFHAGSYYVQEASSMLLEHIVPALDSQQQIRTVLDLCAAPGGKTTLLASALPGSFIVANEVIQSRQPVLKENVIKWGTGNMAVTGSAADRFSALPGFFDLIVADVPCSGEGLFRKQPGSRLEWSAENARHCSLRQRRILMDVWPALRPGGFLVYSTCTFNPDENEHNMAWLAGQTGAETIPVEMPGNWGITRITTGDAKGCGYVCYPHRVKGEGFFIAVVRKPDRPGPGEGSGYASEDGSGSGAEEGSGSVPGNWEGGVTEKMKSKGGSGTPVSLPKHASSKFASSKHASSKHASPKHASSNHASSHRKKPAFPFDRVPDDIARRLHGWFTGRDRDYEFIRYGKMIHRIGSDHLPLLEQLHSAMPVRYAGIETAEMVRDELKPAHAAAHCPFLDHDRFRCYDLDINRALTFLRSEPLPPPPGTSSGWVLARYNGLGLGWLKHAGNRLNNYYPKNRRIRMR